MSRRRRWLGLATTSALVAACGSGAIVVGDDSTDPASPLEASTAEGATGETEAPEASSPDALMADAHTDAGPTATCNLPATCLATGKACRKKDPNAACPSTSDYCCVTACPVPVQPAPTFCDGGPFAPTYDATGCLVGYACAPVDCKTAGGTCVGLAPGACASKHVGSAAQYSCGGGVGVQCCLP